MSDPNTKLLECVLCKRLCSRADALSGAYRIETMVCSRCYARMQRAPYWRSCFGKPMLQMPNGKKLYGWNPKAAACRELCPDRAVCALVVLGRKPV